MSNTLVLRQVRPRAHAITTSTLSQWRANDERKALRRAAGLPVIAHDLDYPRAEVVGPCHGEMRLHVTRYDGTIDEYERTAAQRILDLGGTLVTPIVRKWRGGFGIRVGRNAGGIDDPFCDALWSLPRELDPHVVEHVLARR